MTAERIVDAAIELLNRDGLASFSMRRLAEQLGTAPGSIYRHFESRDAVLVAVHDHLIGQELNLPSDVSGDWLDRLENVMHAQYAFLRRYAYLANIWSTTEQLGPNALRAREQALQLAIESGLPQPVVSRLYLTLLHYTVAFAVLHNNLSFRTVDGRAATEQFFETLSPDQFPGVRQLAHGLAHSTVDEEFELGLQTILAGLRTLSSTSHLGLSGQADSQNP